MSAACVQSESGSGLKLAQKPALKVHITDPKDGAKVPMQPIVRGTVSNTQAQVWIIVHPMATNGFWVQPKPTVKENGKWAASIFIGREGKVDVGEHFEIMAVANPMPKLRRGDVLDDWPEAQAKSQVIEVVRRKGDGHD